MGIPHIRCPFERLQSRMGLTGSPAKAARMAQVVPAHLVLFDAVHLDGHSLTGLPYTERRALLESLGLDGTHWSTPAAVVGHEDDPDFVARYHQAVEDYREQLALERRKKLRVA
ncbi:hypothetical protein [Streptomyces sp. NPDC058240]|uniref:ATP-dependent DNA ligase n=1 Tax=Streptomyces sp. NPDC058240 TaxID=3346396 RepID=UPI0036E2F3AF